MIRVGVVGAAGKMGRTVCRAVIAQPDMQLVAAVSPRHAGASLSQLLGEEVADLRVSGGLEGLLEGGAEVAVDFTTPAAVRGNLRWYVEQGLHAVVGTTGLGEEDLSEIASMLEGRNRGLIWAPNFSLGAVLMMKMAAMAAAFFQRAEVVEMHHEGKKDAPSGTALRTAELIAEVWRKRGETPTAPGVGELARGQEHRGVQVHAVRLPGLVAHQEVIFGGEGQVLTIRHDSLDRTSFMPGVLMAIREVVRRPGLTVGLEPLLGL